MIDKKRSNKYVKFVTIINYLLMSSILLLNFFKISFANVSIEVRYIIIAGIFILSLTNICLYLNYKSCFKYRRDNSKKNNNLKIFLINFSRKYVYFVSTTLLILVIDRLVSTNSYDDLNESVAILFAISFVFEIVSLFTDGLLNGTRLILIMIVCWFSSDLNFIKLLLGSAGLKILFDWIFSEKYLDFLQVTNKDENIQLIRELLDRLKIRVISGWNIVLVAVNLTYYIRYSLPTSIKSEILCFMRNKIFQSVPSNQLTAFHDNFIIGIINISSVALIMLFLYFYFSKILVKQIKGYASDK